MEEEIELISEKPAFLTFWDVKDGKRKIVAEIFLDEDGKVDIKGDSTEAAKIFFDQVVKQYFPYIQELEKEIAELKAISKKFDDEGYIIH